MRVFDVHVHVYPDKLAPKAARGIGEFYDRLPTRGDGTISDCMRRMDAAGVERFAAHAVALTPHNVESINAFLLELRARYPRRIVPFAAVHPDVADAQALVDALVERGFRGAKLHPDIQRFALDSARAENLMEALQGRLTLLIHAGDWRYDFDGPRRILRLRQRFPRLRLICAHFGGWSEWHEAMELLPGHDLMIDTSSTLYALPAREAVEAIRRFGAENVLYGSDYPMWAPEEELERFLRLELTNAEREAILWNNAANLFGEM